MTDLAALIERVEKATGESREIDGLVFGLVEGLRRNSGTFQIGDKFQFEHPTERHPNGPAALYVDEARVPEYTSSLDAVVGLLEKEVPGAGWTASNYSGCFVHHPNGKDVSLEVTKRGARGLLLAFLRARQAAAAGDAP